jgi:hypothetical protein
MRCPDGEDMGAMLWRVCWEGDAGNVRLRMTRFGGRLFVYKRSASVGLGLAVGGRRSAERGRRCAVGGARGGVR